MDNVRKPRIILRRIRGGRKCGSGSGSTIWERHKRNGIQLKTISKRTIRLRSGIRFEINAVSHSFKSFQQIVPSHRRHIPARHERLLKEGGFLSSSDRHHNSQMQDFKGEREGSYIDKTELSPVAKFVNFSRSRQREAASLLFRNLHLSGVPPI